MNKYRKERVTWMWMLREGVEPLLKLGKAGTSLVVQGVRISLPMQGT